MLRPLSLFERLSSRLTDELSRQSGVFPGELLSITLALPDLPFRRLPAGLTGYRYCACPESRRYLLGLGNAISAVAAGAGRLRKVCDTFGELRRRWVHADPDDTGLQPHAFVAFAFDQGDTMEHEWAGFPNTLLEVPAVLLQSEGMVTAMTFTCHPAKATSDSAILSAWLDDAERILTSVSTSPGPAAFPNPLTRIAMQPEEEDWLALAERATSSIRTTALHKVVLARRVTVQAQRRLDPVRVMAALAYRYPACTQIAVDVGDSVLVAASPERLVEVRAGTVASDAIAGTARRSANEAVDRRLETRLLACAKSRHEHALVVNHIAEGLTDYCSELRIPDEPEILSLRFIHHLHSPISGRLEEACALPDLLERLHPTPAVGGAPTEQALAWLKVHEPLRRGWYTGAMGWVTPSGDGEFAVVLRCALVRGRHADLFAGAGIVGDSDPAAELEETELKLQTLLDALQDA
jgi:menaquinone-specific isochorismate synthase